MLCRLHISIDHACVQQTIFPCRRFRAVMETFSWVFGICLFWTLNMRLRAATGYTSSTNSCSLILQLMNNKSFPDFTVPSEFQTQRLFPRGWADSPSNSWVQFWKRNILIVSNAELCFCVFMLTTQQCWQPSSQLLSQLFATQTHMSDFTRLKWNWLVHPWASVTFI